MSKQTSNKMTIFKILFIVLLALECVSLISAVVSLIPTFKMLGGYDTVMVIVTGTMMVMSMMVMAVEILAKIFLIRNTSPNSPRAAGRKGYVAWAVILLVFNFGAVLVNLLSSGGVGATLLNQARLYLKVLASVAEIVTVFCFLGTAKKLSKV